jgi:hypothetical protein
LSTRAYNAADSTLNNLTWAHNFIYPYNLIPTLIWGISLQARFAVQKELVSLQSNRSWPAHDLNNGEILKKSLVESKVIRSYMLLWGLFVFGLLIAFLFGETQTQWRKISIAGVILSFVSLMGTILIFFPVQAEIKSRFPNASTQEKVFLKGLFYFVRGLLLLTGVLILLATLGRKDVLAKDLLEVGGKITSIEVDGGDSSNLKVMLENNLNEYETRTFKIQKQNLERIENELQPGEIVFILIERKDENAVNDLYIQIYGIRTAERAYLSLDEYNKEEAANNTLGMILGIFFAGPGLIYLLTGSIKGNPTKLMSEEQEVSRA